MRLGTAEFYTTLGALPEINDSLVVHLDDPTTGHGQLILFLVPANPGQPADELAALAAKTLRAKLSPRHVPDRTIIAPEIPYTRTGKKLEVPVKRLLQGADPDTITSPGALANPGSLAFFHASLLTQ
ncbi:AMP-binding enzyme [Nocardia abscessus]|uniref:AMP-binding enzyme n=1 Tax=Nocardia abscessus TaxID=120957 RepID=UPI002B4B42EB|nr:hypothetical protein [Nocardia abscessus]